MTSQGFNRGFLSPSLCQRHLPVSLPYRLHRYPHFVCVCVCARLESWREAPGNSFGEILHILKCMCVKRWVCVSILTLNYPNGDAENDLCLC